jgi:phosphoglycerate kinase
MELAQKLANLADLFVNDAFGTAHRAHSSTEGVTHFKPGVAGFLLEKEIQYLSSAIENPKRPFIAILGGAKISDKIGVIKNLLNKADKVLIGGGMANTFFKAQGFEMADSLVQDEALETAKEILSSASSKLVLPVDLVIADAFDNNAAVKEIPVSNIPAGWRVLDIGPRQFLHIVNLLRMRVLSSGMDRWEYSKWQILQKVLSVSQKRLLTAMQFRLLVAVILSLQFRNLA